MIKKPVNCLYLSGKMLFTTVVYSRPRRMMQLNLDKVVVMESIIKLHVIFSDIVYLVIYLRYYVA